MVVNDLVVDIKSSLLQPGIWSIEYIVQCDVMG